MAAKQEKRRSITAGYTTTYKHIPQQPEIERFVSKSRKQIVINLSARKGAKIIKLLP